MLSVQRITKTFQLRAKGLFWRGETVDALRGVSMQIAEGESYGLVGESGSGKSTLARCIVGLETPNAGRILLNGDDVANPARAVRLRLRACAQMVFQDPYSSLNPRMRVGDIVAEPMIVHSRRLGLGRAERNRRVAELLDAVGLEEVHATRFPHEFSGGQRQRIAIARALAARPRMLVLDEPTSALDVSVQAQVLDLLGALRVQMGLTFLFVSHDLGAIRYACDRVGVLRGGEMVEEGSTETVFDTPAHPYTQALLAAVPDLDPNRSISARLGRKADARTDGAARAASHRPERKEA